MMKLRIDDIDDDVEESIIIMTTNLAIPSTSIGHTTATVADDEDDDVSDGGVIVDAVDHDIDGHRQCCR